MTYFSYFEQTLHYFDRPHDGPALVPIESLTIVMRPTSSACSVYVRRAKAG